MADLHMNIQMLNEKVDQLLETKTFQSLPPICADDSSSIVENELPTNVIYSTEADENVVHSNIDTETI